MDSGSALWLWVGWWPRADDGELEPAERSAGKHITFLQVKKVIILSYFFLLMRSYAIRERTKKHSLSNLHHCVSFYFGNFEMELDFASAHNSDSAN